MSYQANFSNITQKEINRFLANQLKLQKQANLVNKEKNLKAIKNVLAYNNQNGEFHKLRKFAQLFIDLYEKMKTAESILKGQERFIKKSDKPKVPDMPQQKPKEQYGNRLTLPEYVNWLYEFTEHAIAPERWAEREAKAKEPLIDLGRIGEKAWKTVRNLYDEHIGEPLTNLKMDLEKRFAEGIQSEIDKTTRPIKEKWEKRFVEDMRNEANKAIEAWKRQREKELEFDEYVKSLKKEYEDYLKFLEKQQQQPQTTQPAQQQSDQPQSQSEGLLSRVGRYALPGAGGVLLGLGLADLMDKKYKKIWPYIKLVSGLGLLALPLLLSSWKR